MEEEIMNETQGTATRTQVRIKDVVRLMQGDKETMRLTTRRIEEVQMRVAEGDRKLAERDQWGGFRFKDFNVGTPGERDE